MDVVTFWDKVATTPTATLLVIVGAGLVVLGVIGKFKEWFRLSGKWRATAIVVGVVMLAGGVSLQQASVLERQRVLIEKSEKYMNAWKERDMEAVLQSYHFPMTKFIELDQPSPKAVSERVKKIFTGGEARRNNLLIQPLLTSYDHEQSSSDAVQVNIVYTSDSPKKALAIRQYITWNNIDGHWKIIRVVEKEFPFEGHNCR